MKLRRFTLMMLIALTLGGFVAARNVKTKLRHTSPTEDAVSTREEWIEATDSVGPLAPDSISFSGFDKPASSSLETFFVNNHMSGTLRGLRLQLTYKMADGRMLHRREVTTDCDVPPGETRQISVKSFDRQGAFRYSKSRRGRNVSTQFEVEIKVLAILRDGQ